MKKQMIVIAVSMIGVLTGAHADSLSMAQAKAFSVSGGQTESQFTGSAAPSWGISGSLNSNQAGASSGHGATSTYSSSTNISGAAGQGNVQTFSGGGSMGGGFAAFRAYKGGEY